MSLGRWEVEGRSTKLRVGKSAVHMYNVKGVAFTVLGENGDMFQGWET